jgi:hypothetical protein
MRFTFGTFKYAVRQPNFRLATAGPAQVYANTTQSLRKAMRIFHMSGERDAQRALEQSLSGAYWRSDIGAGKKRVARELLAAYATMARADGRPHAGFDIKSDVAVGADVIQVVIDAVFFEGTAQYVPRLVIWDTTGASRAEARTLVAPLVVALEQEYGPRTAAIAQLFDVRRANVFEFDRSHSLAGMPDVEAVLRRAQT